MNLSIDYISQKMKDIEELGYSEDEVRNIAREFPAILGLTIENIGKKIRFYDSVGLHLVAVKMPRYLMQSVELSYARYRLLQEKKYPISENSFNKLFAKEREFERQFGIKKADLLKKYNYERDFGEKGTGEQQYTISANDVGQASYTARKKTAEASRVIDEITNDKSRGSM